MRVSKRGKDLAVRLPASIVKELNLSPGDEVDLAYIYKLAEADDAAGRHALAAGLVKVAAGGDPEKP